VAAPNFRQTLLTYLVPQWGRLTLLTVAMLGSISLQLIVPLILRWFIDGALAGTASTGLVTAGIAYLLAGFGTSMLSSVATYLGADIGWTATNRLREDLTEHVLDLDMSFHTDTTPGEMIERIDGDVTAIANFISRFVVRLLGAGLLLLGALAICWLTHWWMGLTLTLYVVMSLVLIGRLRNMANNASEAEREASAQLYGYIEQRLAGLDDIRANGAGPQTMRRFVGVMRAYYFAGLTARMKRALFWVSTSGIFWAGDVFALIVGVLLTTRGSITVGTAYLLVQYTTLVRTPVEQVAQEFQQLQLAAGGLIRIDDIFARTKNVADDGDTPLPDEPLSVQFEAVDFGYEDDQVLHRVDFRLSPGTVLGLLGRSGGGKSTIAKLTSHLYDPTGGRVLLGGIDLRQAQTASVRSAVAVVTQEVQLFRASVRDNLTFFRHDRTDEEILAILDRAGLGDWVRHVGLETQLGADGSGLSAGESQFLAFARVYLQDPRVVILDEPSSRLDPATESIIAAAMERLLSGRTVIVIAHRLGTVRVADEIMVVSDGRIIEHDVRDALLADPTSQYAQLLAAGRSDSLEVNQ